MGVFDTREGPEPGRAGVSDALRSGKVGVPDALRPKEGGLVDGEPVRGESGREDAGEGRGGVGVVAGTEASGLAGSKEAAAAPAPEKTRQAPTASATTRRLCARSPRSVMNEGGAERARD
ncbi:hypothetical protein ACFVZR_27405 [Streptomyces sp. NPDC058316]|uniref:hypothetical protein n=1 Tax=unclassified Streptomyces TaxID=2593676 RepID=UPI00331E1DF5